MKPACLILVSFCALAQSSVPPRDTAPVQSFSLPTDAYWAGAAFNKAGSPSTTGWASWTHLLNSSTQTFSIVSYDLTLSKTLQFQPSERAGLGTILKQLQIGRVNVMVVGFGDLGVATSAQTATGAFTGGGMAAFQYQKWKWLLCVGWREAKLTTGAQSYWELGIGRIP